MRVGMYSAKNDAKSLQEQYKYHLELMFGKDFVYCRPCESISLPNRYDSDGWKHVGRGYEICTPYGYIGRGKTEYRAWKSAFFNQCLSVPFTHISQGRWKQHPWWLRANGYIKHLGDAT